VKGNALVGCLLDIEYLIVSMGGLFFIVSSQCCDFITLVADAAMAKSGESITSRLDSWFILDWRRRGAMAFNRGLLFQFCTISLLSISSVSICSSNNPYHMSEAAAVLTMRECMKCHEKTAMKPVTICLGDNCLYSNSHSLMHPYPPAGKESEYADIAEIEKAGCVLENGRVSCLSCHDLTKPPPHLIRDGDKLCYICHIHLKPGKAGARAIYQPIKIFSESLPPNLPQ
jgi:hypothetical protein